MREQKGLLATSGAARAEAQEIEKAVRMVRESAAFMREVARASEFGKQPEIFEVGNNSLFGALQRQCRHRKINVASEGMKVLQDAGACREAVSAWLVDTDNRTLLSAFSTLKADRATAWRASCDSRAKSEQLKTGWAGRLKRIAVELLDSDTFLGHDLHIFALAHLLDASIAVLKCDAKQPWEIWNARSQLPPGSGTPRLYLSRHGDNFGSLQDLGAMQAPIHDEGEGGGRGEGGGLMEDDAVEAASPVEMEEEAVAAACPLARKDSAISVGELPSFPVTMATRQSLPSSFWCELPAPSAWNLWTPGICGVKPL